MRFEGEKYYWHLIVMLRELLIIMAIQFGSGSAPLINFLSMFLPIGFYNIAVFALHPFKSPEGYFLDCSTQMLLLSFCLGGLLITQGTTTVSIQMILPETLVMSWRLRQSFLQHCLACGQL